MVEFATFDPARPPATFIPPLQSPEQPSPTVTATLAVEFWIVPALLVEAAAPRVGAKISRHRQNLSIGCGSTGAEFSSPLFRRHKAVSQIVGRNTVTTGGLGCSRTQPIAIAPFMFCAMGSAQVYGSCDVQ